MVDDVLDVVHKFRNFVILRCIIVIVATHGAISAKHYSDGGIFMLGHSQIRIPSCLKALCWCLTVLTELAVFTLAQLNCINW